MRKFVHSIQILYFPIHLQTVILEIQRNIHILQQLPYSTFSIFMDQTDLDSSLRHSEAGQSKKFNSSYGADISSLGLNSDSDDDDEKINLYHSMLKENLSQFEAMSYHTFKQDSLFGDDQEGLEDNRSMKSHFSTASVKSFHTDGSEKSLQTMRTDEQSGGGIGIQNKEYNRQKRKYMKQEARRIKQELKREEMQMKKEKKEFKDMDIDPDGKRRMKGFGKGRRKRLTKKTLELLAKKFDQIYAYQNNYDYKGPKMTIRQVGQLFDMGNSTIHKLYTEWMEDPCFYERINRQNLSSKTPERKVTLQRLEHVARLIKENPFLTQNQLTVQLNKIQDLKFVKNGVKVEITRTTVARLLKVGKFKKKRVKCVPKERNTTKSLEKRHDYCSTYQQIWKRNAKVYFLDESGFNLYMTRDKAWARPNEEITVNCPISKGKRFSLIAIIAEDGLAHWRIIEGTYRKYQYLDFIKQLFARLKEEQDQLTQEQRLSEENLRQKWLILDNCAIHDKEQTVSLGRQCGMQILYLPPYSPQLNPIQNWFNEVKAKIRKINYSGQKQLLQIMHRTLKEYQNFDFSNYFRGILKHVEKGINKQRF